MPSPKKLILVIGATGAQGLAVIDGLLSPRSDGLASPYCVRALTRDPHSRRAQQLTAKGVHCVQGSFEDFSAVSKAFEGVYGVWVNTDGFTVGEQKEIYCGMRIFELAKQSGWVKHYVWSSLDYGFKKGNYNPIYRCEHYDGKARVAEWIKAQASESYVPDSGGRTMMSWTIVTSCPYMDMLFNMMFGPLSKRPDGTFVFATPIGTGHVPMIALSDLGYWARYTFDHQRETSGKELEIASDVISWEYLVNTFQEVTKQKATVVHQTLEEWFANFEGVDDPIANEQRSMEPFGHQHSRHYLTHHAYDHHLEDHHGNGGGSGGRHWRHESETMTWKENFSGWWALWRDDVIHRDLNWIRSINPRGHTLKSWMKEKRYTGEWKRDVLKNTEDGKTISPRWERISRL